MNHKLFMSVALAAAKQASQAREVPIGAVVVNQDNRILAVSRNRREADKDPIAHAEILAIRKAAQRMGDWRLYGCRIYVTLEPCPMCAGAILQARIKTVYYGASDLKAGAFGSLIDLRRISGYNHHLEAFGGIMAKECGQVLKDFFQQIR
jgi:tRNA(adenine34) deaminase